MATIADYMTGDFVGNCTSRQNEGYSRARPLVALRDIIGYLLDRYLAAPFALCTQGKGSTLHAQGTPTGLIRHDKSPLGQAFSILAP
jgi:hypothetical protein